MFNQDYLTIGNTSPRQDSQQDWKLTNATEENGVTTLKFYRKRDTNDQQNDVAVQVKHRSAGAVTRIITVPIYLGRACANHSIYHTKINKTKGVLFWDNSGNSYSG